MKIVVPQTKDFCTIRGYDLNQNVFDPDLEPGEKVDLPIVVVENIKENLDAILYDEERVIEGEWEYQKKIGNLIYTLTVRLFNVGEILFVISSS